MCLLAAEQEKLGGVKAGTALGQARLNDGIAGGNKVLEAIGAVGAAKAMAGGGFVFGASGPCIVGNYLAIVGKCGAGGQAHHIIADKTWGTTNRPSREAGIGRIPGGLGYDGPSICLQGGSKVKGTQHNRAHDADAEVDKLGKLPDNGPQGTAPVGDIARIYQKHAIAARPECAGQINAAVEKAMRDVDPKQSGRTTDSLPKGESKDHLNNGGSPKPDVKLPKPPGKK